MYTITQIEDAMIARLENQISYLRTCDSLGAFLVDEAEDLTIRFPATYVVYDRGDYNHMVSGVQDKAMIFNVVVMARNLRGSGAARRGEGSDKGAYDLLEDARAALTNQNCGLDIDPLIPVDEEPIEGTRDVAIYVIRFKTRTRFIIA